MKPKAKAIVVSTAPERAALERLLARVNAELGYPKDAVDVGPGVHAPAERTRTMGYTLRTHHARAGDRALLLHKPELRAALAREKRAIAARKSAGKADADDDAIDALKEMDLPDDWQRADTRTRR